VDAGANIGQTLLDYIHAGTKRRYWGIEPNPECLPILRHIIKRNNLRQCSVLDVGLSDIREVGQLHVSPTFRTDTRATLRSDVRPGRDYQVTRVELVPFDELRERHQIRHMSLVKIDVEGAELEVLRGMSATLNTDRPPVLCEVLLRDRSADEADYRAWTTDLMRFLSSVDYVVYRVSKTMRGPRLPATALTAFPLVAWTHFRAGQCDYVFLPAEHAAMYRRHLQSA
jgi:FkbM family methyltransferase